MDFSDSTGGVNRILKAPTLIRLNIMNLSSGGIESCTMPDLWVLPGLRNTEVAVPP